MSGKDCGLADLPYPIRPQVPQAYHFAVRPIVKIDLRIVSAATVQGLGAKPDDGLVHSEVVDGGELPSSDDIAGLVARLLGSSGWAKRTTFRALCPGVCTFSRMPAAHVATTGRTCPDSFPASPRPRGLE